MQREQFENEQGRADLHVETGFLARRSEGCERRRGFLALLLVINTWKSGNKGFLMRCIGFLKYLETMSLDLIYLAKKIHRGKYCEWNTDFTVQFISSTFSKNVATNEGCIDEDNITGSLFVHGGIKISSSSRMSSCTSFAWTCLKSEVVTSMVRE